MTRSSDIYVAISYWSTMPNLNSKLVVFYRWSSKKFKIIFPKKINFCPTSTYKYPNGLNSFHTHINFYAISFLKFIVHTTNFKIIKSEIVKLTMREKINMTNTDKIII
jgi:hypothetical protein